MGRAAHLMTHTVTVAKATTSNSSGDHSYGSQSTISARVVHRRKLVRNAQGDEVAAEKQLISETQIELDDRVWLPGDDTAKASRARHPVAVGATDSALDAYTLYQAWF